jgi:hypothetical protein
MAFGEIISSGVAAAVVAEVVVAVITVVVVVEDAQGRIYVAYILFSLGLFNDTFNLWRVF